MTFDVKLVNTYTYEQFREMFASMVKRELEQYKIFALSSDVVAECFKIAVTEAKKGNVTSETFKGRLEENFNFQLFIHVEKDYLSSSQFLTFCSNFCTQELEVKNTPIEAKNELYKLTHIWDSISFIPDSELLTLLIKDNSILSQLCQVVLKPQIGQKEINLLKSTKDFSLLMLLKIYCTLNQLNYTEERYSGNEGIQIYLDLAKQPLLTQEEEKKYGLLAMQGDLEAKKILCERNLLLVAKVAYQYLGRGLPLDDLIQEGNLGLIRAINRLSTYATYWIRQAIKRAIYDKVRDIRLPVHIAEKLSQYTKIKNALTITLNRVPTVEEIASQMNISVEQLNKLLQNGQTIESLNQKIADQEQEKQDLFVDDSPSLENQVILSDFQVKFIEQMKECINEREFEVLKYRFGLYGENNKTLDEIGKMYHVTRERIRQIEKKALQKLRNSYKMKSFIDYLDNPNGAYRKERKKDIW